MRVCLRGRRVYQLGCVWVNSQEHVALFVHASALCSRVHGHLVCTCVCREVTVRLDVNLCAVCLCRMPRCVGVCPRLCRCGCFPAVACLGAHVCVPRSTSACLSV